MPDEIEISAQVQRQKVAEKRKRTGLPPVAFNDLRNREPDEKSPTEQILDPEDHSTVRPTESTGVNSEFINPTQKRSEEERAQRERLASQEHIKTQMQAKTQMRSFASGSLGLDVPREIESELDLQDEEDAYQEEMQMLYAKDASLEANDMQRQLVRRQMEAAKQKAKAEMAKKIKELTEKMMRKTQEWVTRGLSPGSVFEWEGVFVWMWSIVGWVIWVLNLVTTIFQGATRGKFIKGFLQWLAPPGFDLKDPFTWAIDFVYGIVAVFILLLIFLIVHLFLLTIGVILYGGMQLSSFFEIL